MNIIEAFRLALDTGRTVSSRWVEQQYEVNEIDQVIEDLAVADILSDEWEVVERHDITKEISPGAIRKACAEKCFAPFVAEAIIDVLWAK